jgi:hypothetical protein
VKICICALIAVVLGVWTSNSIALDNESPEGSKVLALEKEWNEVYKRSDVARMDELLAYDYIITIEDGSTFSKLGYIAHNGNSHVHVEISEMLTSRSECMATQLWLPAPTTRRVLRPVDPMNTTTA